jgi:hypothetical protein
MLNVCLQCGVYRAEKLIDPIGPFAICPECGYKQRFNQWFKTHNTAAPPITLVDTTDATVENCAMKVASWVNETLGRAETINGSA